LNVKDLKDGMRKVDIEGKITDISTPRTVSFKNGGEGEVADATLQDRSGSIKLTLWDAQIEQVSVGSEIRVENGYTNSFKGEVSLQVGRYGTLRNLN